MIFHIVALCAFVVNHANGDCGIFTKQEWEGLRPNHVEYLPRPVNLVIIEHTVTPTCSTNEGCANIVRSIQTRHMEELKYWDIGESFLIGGNGKVFEGSGWLHVGAHTYGYNRKSIGISFIGNFNGSLRSLKDPGKVDFFEIAAFGNLACITRLDLNIVFSQTTTSQVTYISHLNTLLRPQLDPGIPLIITTMDDTLENSISIENTPTAEALEAAQNLIKCGVERGHLSPDYNLVAHKQLIATESPGRKVYSEIRRWPHWLENTDTIKNTR